VAPNEEFSRAAVRRKFGLSERQLKSWERQRLIAASESYSFSDLISIQTLLKLLENGIPPRQIGRAMASLRDKISDVKQPLAEMRIVSDGKRIAVYVGGQRMEALTGQILFDFDTASLGDVKTFPERKRSVNRLRESENWFQRGLELEEAGAPASQVIEAYLKVLELNPEAAGALVNLGTIYYRQRKFSEAEKYYRQAIEADSSYPLAQFNLGNLYDEQGRVVDALEHYRRALHLNPQYADAHFNLALLCERTGEALKAVHHWKCYLKLDNAGQWADIARRQLERLRQATVIQSR
jgi:tetratricopeptide (TPR) repeat protein